MSISLDALLGITNKEQTSPESNFDSEAQKLAEAIDEFQNYLGRVETLAKIACFQNEIKSANFSSEDEEKLAMIGSELKLPITADDPEILKKFASFLKEFADSNRLKEREKKAEQITDRMVESGLISAEEVIPKLSELKKETIEDLTILDKALDLHKQNEFLSMGELSETPGHGALTPKDRFVSDLQN
jgi:polyhydroxyalkanoate synthesis regulator phasin